MVGRKFFSVIIAGSITLLASAHVFAQTDVIEQRQKLMKSNSADAKAIKGAVGKKDYASIETKAKEIAGNADKIVELFPKGSDKGETRAKAAIWEKSDEFAKDAKSLAKAANELAAAAKSKDDAAIAVKVKAVSEACGSCHDNFRAKKSN